MGIFSKKSAVHAELFFRVFPIPAKAPSDDIMADSLLLFLHYVAVVAFFAQVVYSGKRRN